MKKFFPILVSLIAIVFNAHAMELNMPTEPMANDAPGLRIGDLAPDFSGVTQDGKNVKLSELYQKGPVVLIFYRGAWCPFCNLHLRSFQEKLTEFEAMGTTLLAVSVDKPEYTQKTFEAQSLGYDVISDPDARIIKSYKLSFWVLEALAQKYKNEYGIDLEIHSGRSDYLIAVPATYGIDTDGIIQFAYANLDYKTRVTPEKVISALNEMLSS